jgi:enoyl-CoA hydratase
MSIVLLEKPAPHVGLVRFNRPEVRNALNTEVRKLIHGYFLELGSDPDIRCVILAGNEKVFAAGADIQEQATRDVVGALNAYMSRALQDCPKPVIAAINGFALGGGCELALQCDILIAGSNAKFGQPELKLGLIPGGGGTQRLTRIIGKHNALYMMLTGNFLDAQTALRMGLVSEVVEGDCEPRALELAKQIAQLPPLAAQQIKEVIHLGADAPLETALKLERKGYQLMFGTQDMREGVSAFIEKRAANFQGR